ncbi:lipopolysaccharide biosynthesis protein [Paenibacillaceae bacterium]|nr:lipopolysaccharide biosynthesis protein [Paenibacillaceae bacterium]
MEIKHYFQLLKKRAWIILLCVVIASTTAAYYSLMYIKPIYEASTKLLVNNTVGQAGSEHIDFGTLGLNLMLIQTYKELVKTPAVMNEVVAKYPDLGVSSRYLTQMVQVGHVQNSQVMTISVYGMSAESAANIVNAVTDVFQQKASEIMKVNNITILNKAHPGDSPVPINQTMKQNVMMSFAISLLFSIALIFLLEYLDDTLKTEEDVMQTLGVPVMAVVPKIKRKDLKSGRGNNVVKQPGGTTYAPVSR